ncbi:hypothetical protein ABZ883_00805 [Streptomyces sp. NPDC046977]|uniref:hypothetical protein n=1 Tax=Streptomyces sp. NPDC046977 TaxID=3154703 RepID=UPI0033DB161E
MPFEDDLGAALRRTADGFSTDNRSLVAGGLARGRTLRRRRTAVTGAVVAVAAVGVAVALVVPAGNSPQAVPATRTPAKAPATATAPTPTPSTRPPEVSGQEMADLLKALLPAGSVTVERVRGTQAFEGGDPLPYAEVVFDDGKGASLLSVDLSWVMDNQQQDNECPATSFVEKDTKCTRTELGDGLVLTVFQGWEFSDGREGPKEWRAVLTTPRGGQIGASEWNAAAEKGSPQTRPDPPLTPAQLGALVRSPSWDKVFDAFTPPS